MSSTNANLEIQKRQRLLLLLVLDLLALGVVIFLIISYVLKPRPLPDLLPVSGVNYPPHYLFSIYQIDQPVGVAVSPGGDRIYVAESGGERLVRIFDRDGSDLGSITTPDTKVGERAPVYLAVDRDGRLFVTDRIQHAIYLFDRDGQYLDAILAPDLTLSKYVAQQAGIKIAGMALAYNLFWNSVSYKTADGIEKTFPGPQIKSWSPVGIRYGNDGQLYLTDVTKDKNRVWVLNLKNLDAANSWESFKPSVFEFGASGQENGQFLFPNCAVVDSQGRVYVSDGNNGRITVWNNEGRFLYSFGRGTGDGALNLPRGLFIDPKDRLHVVDAVGQKVLVYDVSGAEPVFRFSFGDFGADAGMFNFPNDIAMDASGRLYIADRENNRIQVWSY